MPKQGKQGKGKPKMRDRDIGKSLIRSRDIAAQQRLAKLRTAAASEAGLTTAATAEVSHEGSSNMMSILDTSQLDDFIISTAMDQEEIQVHRVHQNDSYLTQPTMHHSLLIMNESQHGKNSKLQDYTSSDFQFEQLSIPRKPSWTRDMTAAEVDRNEKDAFLEWRRSIASIEALYNHQKKVTPFEKNLEVWRQLWRVCERSDLMIQIVDARNPLLYYTEDLMKYVSTMKPKPKPMMLLINKADFLSSFQRFYWMKYFHMKGIRFIFYSAHNEQEKLNEIHYNMNSSLTKHQKQLLHQLADTLLMDWNDRHVATAADDDDDAAASVSDDAAASVSDDAAASVSDDAAASVSDDDAAAAISDDEEVKGVINNIHQLKQQNEISIQLNQLQLIDHNDNTIKSSSQELQLEKQRYNLFSALSDSEAESEVNAEAESEANAEAESEANAEAESEANAEAESEDDAEAESVDISSNRYNEMNVNRSNNNNNKLDSSILDDQKPESPVNDDDDDDDEKEIIKNKNKQINHKNKDDNNEEELNAKVLSREELMYLLRILMKKMKIKPQPKHGSRVCVGMVGYPNVGKSSVINTLLGVSKHKHGVVRVGVSSTPGKTKHFQTLLLTEKLMLCDCPGLVFPSFMNSTGEMICAGILPINQMRDYIEPASVIASRVPQIQLEAAFGLRVKKDLDPLDNPNRPPTYTEMLSAYCEVKGLIAHGSGRWDEFRACKEMLKAFTDGFILYVAQPPRDDILKLVEGYDIDTLWRNETEQVMMKHKKFATRMFNRRMHDSNVTLSSVPERKEEENNCSDADSAGEMVFGDGITMKGIQKLSNNTTIKSNLKDVTDHDGYEYIEDSDSSDNNTATQSSHIEHKRREHKRIKQWGKKGRKLRSKNPYGDLDEELNPTRYVVFSKNRAPIKAGLISKSMS